MKQIGVYDEEREIKLATFMMFNVKSDRRGVSLQSLTFRMFLQSFSTSSSHRGRCRARFFISRSLGISIFKNKLHSKVRLISACWALRVFNGAEFNFIASKKSFDKNSSASRTKSKLLRGFFFDLNCNSRFFSRKPFRWRCDARKVARSCFLRSDKTEFPGENFICKVHWRCCLLIRQRWQHFPARQLKMATQNPSRLPCWVRGFHEPYPFPRHQLHFTSMHSHTHTLQRRSAEQ